MPALVTAVILTALLGGVSFLLSYSGLVAVAVWASVPGHLSWTVPVTIDASILVYTLAVFIFRARGEATVGTWTALVLFTTVSVTANAAHAWDAGTGDWHGIAGAAIAGLAPVSVLLTTHTLAELIVAKPSTTDTATAHATPETAQSAPTRTVQDQSGRPVGRPVPAREQSGPVDHPGPVDQPVPAHTTAELPSPAGQPTRADQPVGRSFSGRTDGTDQPETTGGPGHRQAAPVRLVETNRTAPSKPKASDAEAIAVIVDLMDRAEDNHVSRRTIERALGCGATRAERLRELARQELAKRAALPVHARSA